MAGMFGKQAVRNRRRQRPIRLFGIIYPLYKFLVELYGLDPNHIYDTTILSKGNNENGIYPERGDTTGIMRSLNTRQGLNR